MHFEALDHELRRTESLAEIILATERLRNTALHTSLVVGVGQAFGEVLHARYSEAGPGHIVIADLPAKRGRRADRDRRELLDGLVGRGKARSVYRASQAGHVMGASIEKT